jgi:6-phosphogluconolactonase
LAGENKKINLAFSGGATPKMFFDHLGVQQHLTEKKLNWSSIHVFWVDERCVPPDHPDSNYGMTREHLLQKINIPESNIHRIIGESEPAGEARRYSDEILRHVGQENGMPVFDWLFLGIGDDGHTASIFPDRMGLLLSEQVCETARHPSSGQYRITLTGKPIMLANRTTFLVAGKSKSTVIRQIFQGEPEAERYPAGYITAKGRRIEYYLDNEAAAHITTKCHGK